MLHKMGVNFEISSFKYLEFSLGDTCLSTLVIFSLNSKTDAKELVSFWLV